MNSELAFRKRSEFSEVLHGLTVRVPASSANLGPGFDALALAYQLYCTLEFKIADKHSAEPLITLKGKTVAPLSSDKSNLIYTVLHNILGDSDLLNRVRIGIESDIPLGRGLGSSAAAITGAIWAAYAISRGQVGNDEVLAKACEIEGHADNASASLLGGLVVCANRTHGRGVHTQRLNWPDDWSTVVFVPPAVLSTKMSRSVLPATYSRADAVHNVQKVSLLLAAVQNCDEAAMKEALHDKFHEPYRSHLVPELESIKRELSGLPTLGTVISGAGPSVLTIVCRRHRQQIVDALNCWSEKKCPGGRVLDLSVDQEGLKFCVD